MKYQAWRFLLVVIYAALLPAVELLLALTRLEYETTAAVAQVSPSEITKGLESRVSRLGPIAHIDPTEKQVTQGNEAIFVSKSVASSNAPIIRFEWTGPAGQKSTSRRFTVDTARLSPGNYQVKLRVTDKRERFDDSTAKLVVNPKAQSDDVGIDTRAPVARIDPTHDVAIQGERKRFLNRSYHLNPDGRIVRVNWRTEWGQSGSDNFLDVDTRPLSPRRYWVALDVTDHRGVGSSAKATLEIKPRPLSPPQPPVARIFPRDRTVDRGAVVTFDGKLSSDPDGRIQNWSWKLDSRFLNSGPITQIDTGKLTPRDYTVELEVVDEQHLKSTDSVILKVVPRKRPVDLALADLQVFPDRLAQNQSAEIKLIVTNHGEQVVQNVKVRIQVDDRTLPDTAIATLAANQSRAVTVGWVAGAPGKHIVIATVDPDQQFDDQNRTNNRSTRAVQVLAPLVARIIPPSREVNQGEQAKFTSEITSAPAKTPVTVRKYLWRGPSEITTQNDSIEFDTKDIPPGKYPVTLQVTDENHQTANAAATLMVKALPIALWIRADRDNTYTGQAVLFNGGADYALAGLQFKFVFGDDEESDWLASATTQHSYARAGDYKIRLLARRGTNSLGEAATALRVIDIPYDLELTPTRAGAVYVGNPVTFTATIKPPASDVEYQFRYGDGLQTDWTAASTAKHAYTEEKTYVASAAARIGGKRIIESRAVTIPVRAPISPWLWLSGAIVMSAGAEYVRRRLTKPPLTVSIEPRINLDSITSIVEDHIASSNSIRISSVRGESTATIEPTPPLVGERES